MESSSLSLAQAYHQALVDPKGLTTADFNRLLSKFPYSQPLHFAYERRRFLLGELDSLDGKAILMANNPSWLYDYVQLAVQDVPSIEVVDDDYVPFEDLSLQTLEEEIVDSSAVTKEIDEEEVVEVGADETTVVEEEIIPEEAVVVEESQAAIEEREDEAELKNLVIEGIGGGDYFALHAREEKQKAEAAEVVETKQPEIDEEPEDVSLYNDDLMPYSFRWWLHKTRLEYADTYQPFVFSSSEKTEKMPFDPAKLDKLVLDQQIRQNIIHFQDPEDKLSEEIKQRVVQVVEKKKSSEVIERFIREEPQIQPPSVDHLNTENKARKSSEEQFNFVTETLATIYANQAMYVKAIEVYKKLILKYPEKKSYFATRIKELEEKLY
ncbi:hypothetical protein E2P86_16455 [Sphingobacterium psychroaquaticum]|uniref:hypothetical protein n=1 Tax=Sphingobacterium psychroaquaticum TaxID=561061 RepID=UPI001068F95D|nr:hypothetical protein [Sphingobacterium psychroaquaticum]QBQ42647.1 hypothetical protein E2P86_16455 [Sphingobacterium psychroaquaticum]